MTEEHAGPRVALAGINIALSVSDSADMARLGLRPEHCELAVAEVARAVFLAGGSITYGGHLRGPGYTHILMDEVTRYADARDALILCLPATEHFNLPPDYLRRVSDRLGLSADLRLLTATGARTTIGDHVNALGDHSPPEALSAMRQYVTDLTSARVVIGGRLHGYQGAMPGVVEEALMNVRARKPLYVAGGFGGASAAIGQQIGYDDLAWAPTAYPADVDKHGARPSLAALGREYADHGTPDTGLSDLQLKQLMSSARPADIAALVVRGLAVLAGDPLGRNASPPNSD